MISFKEYVISTILFEGGNVVIDGNEAQHINLEDHDRDIVSDLIMKGLVKLNQSFKDENGLYIWKPTVLKDGKIFSGSTKHFFDQRIATEKFLKHKKTVGDIDLMVDENLKAKIRGFVESHKGEEFASLHLVGSKAAGDQTITLWKLEPTGINIQIDLEFVAFEVDKPSKWSEFSHSSAFEDIEVGVKGAFHKMLMTSLLGHKKTDSILQMKTKQKEIKAGTNALSIKGLRRKYEKIGEQDGKPVIRETGSKEFNTNFYDIMKEAFGYDAKEEDLKHFWSFTGILKLMKEHLEKHEIHKILEDFIERLFGPDAQGLYRGDPNRDLDEKMVAVNLAQKKLGIKFDDFRLHQMQDVFYSKYK